MITKVKYSILLISISLSVFGQPYDNVVYLGLKGKIVSQEESISQIGIIKSSDGSYKIIESFNYDSLDARNLSNLTTSVTMDNEDNYIIDTEYDGKINIVHREFEEVGDGHDRYTDKSVSGYILGKGYCVNRLPLIKDSICIVYYPESGKKHYEYFYKDNEQISSICFSRDGKVLVKDFFSIYIGVMPEFKSEKYEGFLQAVMAKFRYPQEAAIKGVQGKVDFEFFVDTDGAIISVNPLDNNYPILNQAVVKAVKGAKTKWNPGMIDGKPVTCRLVSAIYFRMNSY